MSPRSARRSTNPTGTSSFAFAGASATLAGPGFFHAREISSLRAMDTTPAFPTLRLVSHPLVQHKLSILRDRETPTKIFKELVDEIAMLMAYEATSDIALEDAVIETPLERT